MREYQHSPINSHPVKVLQIDPKGLFGQHAPQKNALPEGIPHDRKVCTEAQYYRCSSAG